MILKPTDPAIRFTGRWNITEDCAITTAPGGMIEIAFTGQAAVLLFDTTFNQQPYPHVWISVDNGPRIEAPIDRYLRINTLTDGSHYVQVIYKSAVEMQHRWYDPLVGKLSFCGAEASGAGALPADNRKTIEFIGDSITEGVLVDAFYQPEKVEQWNRPNQDDAAATYAYLTAEKLHLRPVIMGYGAVGITKGGCGSVPKAAEAYPYCYAGVPIESENADYIVINHGANDQWADEDVYLAGYRELLDLVRGRNPRAVIIALGAFCGAFAEGLREMVRAYNQEKQDSVFFIDTRGWIPLEPLHPLREGHRVLAENLSAALVEMGIVK